MQGSIILLYKTCLRAQRCPGYSYYGFKFFFPIKVTPLNLEPLTQLKPSRASPELPNRNLMQISSWVLRSNRTPKQKTEITTLYR